MKTRNPKFLKKLTGSAIIYLGKRIEKEHFSGEPVIIGACPRSGTTILLAILGAHPDIFAIPKQTYAFDEWISAPGRNGQEKWQPARLDRLYLQFLIHRIPKTAKRWLEKTPKHIQSFDKILEYFDGNVKLINIIRDGRAVVTSKHPVHSPDEYWVPVERWIKDVNAGLSLAGHSNVLNIKYEELVFDFDSTINKVLDFIGEEKSVNIKNWIKSTNIRTSKHWAAPVQDLYKHASDRWRKPEHEERVNHFLNNEEAVRLLKKLGYPD